jgi:hypothetical protein
MMVEFFLKPTKFFDCDNQEIVAKVEKLTDNP